MSTVQAGNLWLTLRIYSTSLKSYYTDCTNRSERFFFSMFQLMSNIHNSQQFSKLDINWITCKQLMTKSLPDFVCVIQQIKQFSVYHYNSVQKFLICLILPLPGYQNVTGSVCIFSISSTHCACWSMWFNPCFWGYVRLCCTSLYLIIFSFFLYFSLALSAFSLSCSLKNDGGFTAYRFDINSEERSEFYDDFYKFKKSIRPQH